MISSGKRKRDDYASQLTSGDYMPQQDGSGDVMIEVLLPEVNSCFLVFSPNFIAIEIKLLLMPPDLLRLFQSVN